MARSRENFTFTLHFPTAFYARENISVFKTFTYFIHTNIRTKIIISQISYRTVSTYTRTFPSLKLNTHQMKECPKQTPWTSMSYVFKFDFFPGSTAPSGPGPPHCRSFTITLRHTTLSRTPLDEWSVRRRDLYLTTHNTHNRQIILPPAGFEPAISASERPQTHALDCALPNYISLYIAFHK